MEEILQKLVESELLTEDTKKELSEALEKEVQAIKESAEKETREKVEAEVRADLAEQFVTDKEALVEALDTKAEQYLQEHIEELKEDIDRFRDLEVEYSEKLVEAKQEMAETVKGDIEELVEALDSYLDVVVDKEFQELHEDIEEVKKIKFGAEIFEAFEGMFSKKFVDEDSVQQKLSEKEQKLKQVSKQLKEAQQNTAKLERKAKMNEVLEDLHGRPREVMEAILKNQPTHKLEEAYAHYIPNVLNEVAETSEKESDSSSVLAEGKEDSKEKSLEEGTVIASGDTGNSEQETLEESAVPEDVTREIDRMKKLFSYN